METAGKTRKRVKLEGRRGLPSDWARAMTTSLQDVLSVRPHTTLTTPSTHTFSSIPPSPGERTDVQVVSGHLILQIVLSRSRALQLSQ